ATTSMWPRRRISVREPWSQQATRPAPVRKRLALRVRNCYPAALYLFWEGHRETSPPAISASGRGRCRAARVFTDRRSASLSVAASARDCALRARWRDRYIRPADRTKANRAAWEPVLRGERYRREWEHRDWP